MGKRQAHAVKATCARARARADSRGSASVSARAARLSSTVPAARRYINIAESFIFFLASFVMRSSIVGIALNPFYILNSFVGVIGCLTLNSVFITCYMGGNTILNFALIVVGVCRSSCPTAT